MKKVIVAAVLLGLLASAFVFAACGGDQVPAGAIASVGDATVTQEQFDQILAQAKAQYASQEGAPAFPKEGDPQYNQLKASIVNYLVQNELIKQQAADMKVTVTQTQLDERIKQVTQQVGGQKKLDELLKKQGVSMEQLTTQLQAQMLQDAVRTKVGENAKVTEEQIKAYFDDPQNKQQFVVPDSVDARHVLVASKADAEKVQQLLAADPSDANWAKVAKKYSIDPGTKDKGGALGNFPKGRMVPEFDKVAFSIKPGTVSVPVKSQFGWHVIEVTKKSPGSSKTFEEAKSMIEQSLKFQVQEKSWTTWLADAVKSAGILYLDGFDPKSLTASPSPAPSSSRPGSAASSATWSRSPPTPPSAVSSRSTRATARPSTTSPPAPPPARSSSRSPGRTGRAWPASCGGAPPARRAPPPCRPPRRWPPCLRAPPSTMLCSARSLCPSRASSTCCAWSAPGTASRRRATSSATPWKRCTNLPTRSATTTSGRSTASSATCSCRSCCSPSCSASAEAATSPA